MRYKISILAGLLALALVTVAAAQTDESQTQGQASPEVTQTISGTVVTSTPSLLTISTDDGQSMSFTTDAESVLPEKLAVGSRVSVQYSKTDSGANHASKVVAFAASDSPKGSDPSSDPSHESMQSSGASSSSATSSAPAGDSGASSMAPGGDSPSSAKMPKTASPFPLIGLVGAAMLACGLGLRAATER